MRIRIAFFELFIYMKYKTNVASGKSKIRIYVNYFHNFYKLSVTFRTGF